MLHLDKPTKECLGVVVSVKLESGVKIMWNWYRYHFLNILLVMFYKMYIIWNITGYYYIIYILEIQMWMNEKIGDH